MRRLERLPALAQLPPDPRQWWLVWAQSFLVHLASRQIPLGPEHAQAFFVALATHKQVPFPEQVKEAAALTLQSLEGARNAFAAAINLRDTIFQQKLDAAYLFHENA